MDSRSDQALWSIDDVAAYLRVPRSSVYKLTARKSTNPIPHIKLGGRLRFRRPDIDAWLELWSVSPMDALGKARRQATRVTE